jgi:hypothetical protein
MAAVFLFTTQPTLEIAASPVPTRNIIPRRSPDPALSHALPYRSVLFADRSAPPTAERWGCIVLVCAEATRLFLLRRYLILGVPRARRLEASYGGTDLCTAAADLSALSRRVADASRSSKLRRWLGGFVPGRHRGAVELMLRGRSRVQLLQLRLTGWSLSVLIIIRWYLDNY